MARTHTYTVQLTWTGNLGEGTRTYRGYSRDHELMAEGRPPILGSSDPSFRGDPARWNPEQLFVASLAACHKLWYLHLCADAGVSVESYEDEATGTMVEDPSSAGEFTEVVLHPRVRLAAGGDVALARALHERAGSMCFLARSVRFPVRVEDTCFASPF